MNNDWYMDPTAVAAKVTGVVGAIIALVSAVPDVIQGQASAETLTAPLVVLATTAVALWAIWQARKRAYKPQTVAELVTDEYDAGFAAGRNL